MITKVTHMCIYVLDQDRAYDFYVNKLGFKVHTDAPMGEGARWLTICPPEQPELEITLFLVKEGGMFDNESVRMMTELFKKPPTKEFYGFEALFLDDSGNWFSLSQLN